MQQASSAGTLPEAPRMTSSKTNDSGFSKGTQTHHSTTKIIIILCNYCASYFKQEVPICLVNQHANAVNVLLQGNARELSPELLFDDISFLFGSVIQNLVNPLFRDILHVDKGPDCLHKEVVLDLPVQVDY